MEQRTCLIPDCGRTDMGARGWCQMHYRRYQRHGDPLATSRIVGDDVARFWSYVNQDGPTPEHRPELGPCWVWTGYTSPDGYAILAVREDGRKTTRYMARWSYEHHVAPIPEGHEPDHLCRNRPCVRPDHLEPVTHTENVLRGESPQALNARKTHCSRGHEFTPENTGQQATGRFCRACKRMTDARRAA